MNAQTKALGTVLPSAESLAQGEAHAARITAQQKQMGAALAGCRAQTVGGEARYYRTNSIYAVVTRSLAVRWFEARADGDYPVPAPAKGSA